MAAVTPVLYNWLRTHILERIGRVMHAVRDTGQRERKITIGLLAGAVAAAELTRTSCVPTGPGDARSRCFSRSPTLILDVDTDAARTVWDRMMAMGLSEDRARQHLADKLVLVDGEVVTDPDHPAALPVREADPGAAPARRGVLSGCRPAGG